MDALPSRRVRLSGLQKAAHLNGKLGTVTSYDAEAGRYAVSIDGGDGVRIKLANLEPVADEAPAPAPAPAPVKAPAPAPVPAPEPLAPLSGPMTEADSIELLECARYGEVEELQQLLDAGVPVDFVDDGGNAALHKASANGHLGVVERLLAAGASVDLPNESGNRPLHWAVQQGHLEVTQALLASGKADVLVQNHFGRSVVTEAFDKADARVVEVVLQHSSAKGLEPDGADGDEAIGDEGISGEATHAFTLADDGVVVRVRELAQLGSDLHYSTVLGATAETDRTGLQLWAAALVMSHWLIEMKERLAHRSVLELGAGCGLCGIVAARHCAASKVLITDLADATMDNLRHNLALNELLPEEGINPTAAKLDWFEPAGWPAPVDVLMGSDLVYSADAVPHLQRVVETFVAPGGCFLHVSPHSAGGQVEHRQGGQDFIDAMCAAGWQCQQSDVPPTYTRNVLQDADDEEFELLFDELQTRTYMLYAFSRKSEF